MPSYSILKANNTIISDLTFLIITLNFYFRIYLKGLSAPNKNKKAVLTIRTAKLIIILKKNYLVSSGGCSSVGVFSLAGASDLGAGALFSVFFATG